MWILKPPLFGVYKASKSLYTVSEEFIPYSMKSCAQVNRTTIKYKSCRSP